MCDSLRLHSGPLSSIRGATPPSRNGLSHANRERPAEMAEQLFWPVLEHLGTQSPGFVAGGAGRSVSGSSCLIHVVDSHDHGTGGQLHGLGQAPPAQGGGQDAICG